MAATRAALSTSSPRIPRSRADCQLLAPLTVDICMSTEAVEELIWAVQSRQRPAANKG